MKTPCIFTASAACILLSRTALAEDVTLPAPFLEWSVYVLLLFALLVAVGVFIRKGKRDKKDEFLGTLLGEQEAKIHSVRPDLSVTECVRLMNELDIGAMLVMEDDQLLGIFTERDAITRVLGAGLEPSYTKVAAVMSHNPICVSPSTTLDEAMTIISNQRIRHLPVAQDGKVLGMISSGDLTHWLLEDKSGEIRELVDIAGRRRDPR
jgi:signal-transduction protein with cAMP-binding, CBS, and nucleotidyltransferase domain